MEWFWSERKTSFGGYAGIYHTADKIKQLIPKSKIYVEPFAGLARTCEDKHDKVILNDMSDFANKHNKEKFPFAIITKMDFIDCLLKWDSNDTFFLIDPPWFDREYINNNQAYCNMKAKSYYFVLECILPKLKGQWIVLSKSHNAPTKNWNYDKMLIESDKNVLFGKKAKTLLTFSRKCN